MSNHVALAVVDAVSPKVSVLPVELLRYFVVAACKITHVVMFVCVSSRQTDEDLWWRSCISPCDRSHNAPSPSRRSVPWLPSISISPMVSRRFAAL